MNKKTNYENDLFYLTLMINTIDKSFKIKLDRNLFFDRIVEELLFIDQALQKLYTSLRDNKNLINREDFLHLVLKAKVKYRECIDQFLEMTDEEDQGEGSVKSYFPQFERTRKTHERDMVDIMNILRASGESIDEYADITSRDEMSFLMTTIETDEDDE